MTYAQETIDNRMAIANVGGIRYFHANSLKPGLIENDWGNQLRPQTIARPLT